jgi:uncharacterized protein (TIGR03000 family)
MVAAGLVAVSERASAWHYHGVWPQTATYPTANPPGWYTNTYYFAWQYPWFAYYNYSHGPYANWMSGGGFAGYNIPEYGHPMYHGVFNRNGMGAAAGTGTNTGTTTQPAAPCTMTINLPADAKLLFNGTLAGGTGSVRTFKTPALTPGMDYAYELTAEVIRDGKPQRMTERVVVRAGEKTNVTLGSGVIHAAGTR